MKPIANTKRTAARRGSAILLSVTTLAAVLLLCTSCTDGGNVNPSDTGSGNASQTEPVVGWLVCVEGAMRGNDYRIRAGYNYIGREIGDIHIRGDQTISRQRHAKIAYDADTHQYFFSPDEGRNLLRVNGKTIMIPVELHNYDILTIGQTKLMFVALCGDHFSWGQG